MPGSTRTQPVPVPFPVKGVDRSMPVHAQPDLTCPDALNVRGFDRRDRMGGGKRAGLNAAFDRAGASGARAIHGLGRLTEASSTPGGNAGSYVSVTENFSTRAVTTPTDLGTDLVPFYVISATRSGAAANTFGVSAGPVMVFGGAFTVASTQAWGLGVNFLTSNVITAVFRANGQSTTAPDTNGANDECTHMGPFIRGNGNFTNFLAFRFVRTGADTVTPQLIQVTNGVAPTVIQTLGAAKVLNSSATLVDDLSVTVSDVSGNVRVVVTWPTQSYSLDVTVTTATYAGNSCGGIAFVGPVAWSSVSATTRHVTSISYTKIVPNTAAVVHQYFGTTANAQTTPLQYFIPDGWTTFKQPGGAVASTVAAGPSQTSSQTSLRIDDTNNILIQEQITAFQSGGIYRTTEITRYGVEIRHLDTTSGNLDDFLTIALRINTTAGANIYDHVRVRLSGSAATPTSANRNVTKCIEFSSGRVDSINGGTVAHNLTPIVATLNGFTCRVDDWIRVTDDGSMITISVNGRVVHPPISVGTYASNTVNGAYPYGGAVVGSNAGAFGFRLIDQGAASSMSIGEATSKIVICTTGLVDIGTLNMTTLTRCAGTGLNNPIVQIGSFNRKWYAVDGETSKVIDPVTDVVSDWGTLVTSGTLPGSCRFVSTYRGRMVLARQSTNASIWYMSRVFNPYDWDFGAQPTNTSAVAGTNADVGQPGDAITCLIPFRDDYLIFGCANSIWMLEGDPGYGGAIQNVSFETGIIGPRAFCFDEDGFMYFMGSGGFYRMVPGDRAITPISGRRLSILLDRVNTNTTMVQLAYDAFKAYVHIFLTPTDGTTVGTHVIWDKRADAFWIDKYPLQAGPLSVCQIVGTDDEDRRILLGGMDGYVRRFSDDATDDHDTTNIGDAATVVSSTINSYIRFPVMQMPMASQEVLLTEFQAAFANEYPAAMTWYWVKGRSADECNDTALASGPPMVQTGGFAAASGFNTPVRMRFSGGVIQPALAHNVAGEKWALEHMTAYLGPSNRRRGS